MEQKQQQRQANRTMNQENRREKRRQLQSYVRKRHQSGCKKPVQKACANHSDKIALTSANKKVKDNQKEERKNQRGKR